MSREMPYAFNDKFEITYNGEPVGQLFNHNDEVYFTLQRAMPLTGISDLETLVKFAIKTEPEPI